jgi:hypothetical protein
MRDHFAFTFGRRGDQQLALGGITKTVAISSKTRKLAEISPAFARRRVPMLGLWLIDASGKSFAVEQSGHRKFMGTRPTKPKRRHEAFRNTAVK